MRSKLAFTSFPFLKFGRCHFWSFSVQVKDKNSFLCVAKCSNCRSITITWQQRPHFPTAHSQKPFLGTLSMNKTVAVRVTSEEKLFNMLGLTNNWLPFLKTSMVFIRLGENIRWALRNCSIIPCRLLDWYVLITSFEVLRKREVLHFHPAVGGGISCLNRAVVKLYFTEMFFILLLSKAGSSLNGSNLCNNSLLVPEALSFRLLQISPKFFVLSDSRQSSFMTFFTAAKAILGESSFTFPAIFFHFRPAKLITSARLPRYEIRQWTCPFN